MLGVVYNQLCIPSKIILRVFAEFVSILRWNSMLRGVYIWLCVFSKIILWVLAEFASILPRSSMTRGVYVRLCVHSKIVLQVSHFSLLGLAVHSCCYLLYYDGCYSSWCLLCSLHYFQLCFLCFHLCDFVKLVHSVVGCFC